MDEIIDIEFDSTILPYWVTTHMDETQRKIKEITEGSIAF